MERDKISLLIQQAVFNDIPPPKPATESCSDNLEPGRPSRARSANTRHPPGWPHNPPSDRMYATDVR